MTRSERRYRTDLKITYRDRQASFSGFTGGGHRWHKTEHLGHCSNRGCWLCACERSMKRDAVKLERREGRDQEREAA